MEPYRKWIDAPWRDMPSWMRAVTLVVVIAGANVLDHAIGGVAGLVVALVIALVGAVLIPFAWQALQG
ncbi:MAG: hypothetical protein NVSMB22_27670 [Chloroflexota bacterium]